jgi:hypothetical protein
LTPIAVETRSHLRAPLEESLELLCGFPFNDDDELGGASDEAVMKNPSALGVLSDLLVERDVGLQALDGFGEGQQGSER